MTARDFCFWLQGFFELTREPGRAPAALTAEQAELVKRHLALVFKHEIDPSMGPSAIQQALDQIHNPNPQLGPQQVGFDASGIGGPIMRC